MDARGDIQGIQRVLIRGSRFVLWAVLPIQVGLVVLGKPFLTLWMGQRYAASSYPTLVILALPLALVITQAVGAIALYGNRSTSLVLPGDIIVEAATNLLLSVALRVRWASRA